MKWSMSLNINSPTKNSFGEIRSVDLLHCRLMYVFSIVMNWHSRSSKENYGGGIGTMP